VGTDEARLGLKPILRRVWAPKGQRPQAVQRRGYQWTYLFGFLQPSTGRVEWLLLPSLNRRAFEVALREFAEVVGAGPNRRVLLVLDIADAHKHIEVPEGLPTGLLPELQPAERLWPLVREVLATRLFQTLDAIEGAIGQRC
jgi:hypothetical protein